MIRSDLGISLNVDSLEGIKDVLSPCVKNSNFTVEQQQRAKMLLSQAIAESKILELFCDVINKESAWTNAFFGSCICYFAHLSSVDYKRLLELNYHHIIKDKFAAGFGLYLKKQLLETFGKFILHKLGKSQAAFMEMNPDFILDVFTSAFLLDQPLEQQCRLRGLYNARAAIDRISGNLSSPCNFPQEGDPHLFSLLISKNPKDRNEGLQMAFNIFGRPASLKDNIRTIKEAYTAAMKLDA
jgi:hypothetical protein